MFILSESLATAKKSTANQRMEHNVEKYIIGSDNTGLSSFV